MPTPIDAEWTWETASLNALLEKAAVKLGELNSYARLVPSIGLFIQLHVTKEAVVSSRIEGTQTNLGEALLPKAEIQPERRDDWQEVNNYIRAMNEAITELKTLPISSRLLRATHLTLLSNGRGEHKQPGEFRRSQNWIGGRSLADAAFIPPHDKLVPELMGDLENFLHNDDINVPALIRIGMAHYQFETIHPFLDGNGRIGRLLITLYLVSEGILDKPLLYLSAYFEQNKNLYYDNLMVVRQKSDLVQWLKYFLVGIEQTAAQAVTALSKMLDLKLEMEQQIHDTFGRRAPSALRLLPVLFQTPALTVEAAATATGLSYRVTNEVMAQLQTAGYLQEITGQSRNRIFVFEPYLKAFDNV
ncbi:Fic family protein [Hymenobacter aerophilus]|uniref:Fic family protein n=1 Tax=Hymenobacter aerophilus TaxID=119644 RepID=UPI001F0AECFC|nr:Fic family protein [Hymenobacter aerophilus]